MSIISTGPFVGTPSQVDTEVTASTSNPPRAHSDDIDALNPPTPDGDTLTTTWLTHHGDEEEATDRETGQTDDAFVAAHKLNYTLRMLDGNWPVVGS